MNIQETHQMIWNWREVYGEYFPTPNLWHSVLFSLSEIGEAADAILRQEPQYKRNNNRNPNYFDEIADTAFMLHTALGKDYIIKNPDRVYVGGFRRAAQEIGFAVDAYNTDTEDLTKKICLRALRALYGTTDNLPDLIASRLEKLYEKHIKPHDGNSNIVGSDPA